MLKKYLAISMSLALLLFACAKSRIEDRKLVIYAYDSFASDWGPGPKLAELFSRQSAIELDLRAIGNSTQTITAVIQQKDKPQADVLVGIDHNILADLDTSEILENIAVDKISNLENIPPSLLFDKNFTLLPFDYGYLAINYNSLNTSILGSSEANSGLILPESLADLTKEIYRKQVAIIDPRSSLVGLNFLYWTVLEFGEEGYLDFWERLRPNILVSTRSWSEAYGIYTSNEVPFVLSFSTSPIYHKIHEDKTNYKSILFAAGNYRTIEGMGIIKGSKMKAAAELFIDFMLSVEAQKIIAELNIMLPANPLALAELPAEFSYNSANTKGVELEPSLIRGNRKKWLADWSKVIAN